MFLTKKLKLEFYESEQNLFLIYPAFLAPRFFLFEQINFLIISVTSMNLS